MIRDEELLLGLSDRDHWRAMDACGLGNMGAVASSPEPVARACGSGSVKASRLGGGESLRSVRANIPDLVAALTMAILYACRPGKSMPCKPEASGSRLQTQGFPVGGPKGRLKASGEIWGHLTDLDLGRKGSG